MTLTTHPTPVPASELAALRDAAAAFIRHATGGRGTYIKPASGSHQIVPCNQLACLLFPDAPEPADGGHVPLTTQAQQAAWLAGTIHAAIWLAGGPHTPTWRHYPAAADPAHLAALPLPHAQAITPGQPAALLDNTPGTPLEHHLEPASLHAAYTTRPRTRVHPDIGHGHPGTWPALTTTHLTSHRPPATCSLYESAHGDHTLPTHTDAWLGVIIQIHGTKHWHLTPPPAGHITTTPGDILLLPKHQPHTTTTPPAPGHSTHLTFALNHDPPHTPLP